MSTSLMKTDMRLFQESTLLAFLLVAGICIIGILLREIYLMRRQLKIELGTKSRVKHKPGDSKKKINQALSRFKPTSSR